MDIAGRARQRRPVDNAQRLLQCYHDPEVIVLQVPGVRSLVSSGALFIKIAFGIISVFSPCGLGASCGISAITTLLQILLL